MKFQLFLFLAVLNGGISTYRPMWSPCKMRNTEAMCSNKELLQIPPELHPEVHKIDVSGNKIQNITKRPLNFYASLQDLDLSSNRIGFVEPGVFAEMKHLKDLNLANNQLFLLAQENVSVGLLPQVRTLDLSGNRLYNEMADHFLHRAPALQHLSLAENSITEISHRIFQGSPALVDVNLHSNMIMEIEEGAFESLRYLSKLNLSMNSLTCISEFNLKQLQVLDLSRNSIETFHSTKSDEEFNLVWLDLSENKLLKFPVLPQVNKLAYLNLTKNIMQFVMVESPGDAEEPWQDGPLSLLDQDQSSKAHPPFLPALIHLDLSHNEIRSIPSDFFTSMLALRSLNLSKNCLQTFVASSELVSLTILDLSSNSLENLEVEDHTLGVLREFHLQDNKLRVLHSDVFQGLPHLQWVDLRRNQVSLCGLYSGLGRQRVSVEEQQACVSFMGLPELRYLFLSDNHLTKLPVYSFFRTQLKTLDLSMNWGLQIEAKSLSGLELSLEHLDLHGNGLTTLNVDFPLFSSLRYLNLSDNQLSWLPPWSENCCVLEVLDLQNNSFNSLKNSQIPALEKNLRNLYLVGNPLSCCGNIWLSHMIHKAVVEIPNLDLVKCQMAKTLGYEEEMNVSHVRPEDCEREDLKNMGVVILLAIILVLSLIIVGVGLACCYRKHWFGRHYKV